MRIENKYKFMAAVTGLLLIPFLLLSMQFIYGTKNMQNNNILRYLEMRTLTGSRIVSGELNVKYNLSALAADRGFRGGGSAGRRAAIEQKVKESPMIYSELAVLTLSGEEAYRASAGTTAKTPFNYGRSEVFSVVKKTGAAAGAVEFGEYTPPALIIVEPVSAGGGKADFYLAGRLSLAYLGELVRLMGRNSQGNFGLADGGGQLVADSASLSTVRPGAKAPAEILEMISAAMEREAPAYTGEVMSGGRKLLASVSNVPGSKWWIYEIVDPAEIPVPGRASKLREILLSAAGIIVISNIMIYFLALRWLVRGKDEEQEAAR